MMKLKNENKSIKSMNEKARKSYKIRNKNKIGIKLRNKK